MSNVYVRNGYDSRRDYLESLAEEYGVEVSVIYFVADLLGPSEDFDGLISELEDLGEGILDL